MNTVTSILTYLDKAYSEPIRDPLWHNIMLSNSLKKIVQHPLFQKLGGIKQLGPSHLVYPGATHTRLLHSLGVFHTSKRIIHSLLQHPLCPKVTEEGVKGFLCAALLHDLGHYPFAHSLKELPLRSHEDLTAELILTTSLKQIIKEEVQTDPRFVAAIIDLSMDTDADPQIHFFRRILSGVMDPDKLDYLTRDAYFCGVPYGIQDIDFVIDRIAPHPDSGIVVHPQGVAAVENILFSKYLMYRTVYWHRTVRIATAMIKKAVYLGMQNGEHTAEQLYHLDDEEFFTVFAQSSFPPYTLIHNVQKRHLYKTVYELPFDCEKPFHKKLTSLSQRLSAEEELTRMIGIPHNGSSSIIIDIPESISFEFDVPITAEGTYVSYVESEPVFTKPVIQRFTSSLRKLRVLGPPEVNSPRQKDTIIDYFTSNETA